MGFAEWKTTANDNAVLIMHVNCFSSVQRIIHASLSLFSLPDARKLSEDLSPVVTV